MKPIAYFHESGPVRQLEASYGSYLERMAHEEKLSMLHCLTFLILSEYNPQITQLDEGATEMLPDLVDEVLDQLDTKSAIALSAFILQTL